MPRVRGRRVAAAIATLLALAMVVLGGVAVWEFDQQRRASTVAPPSLIASPAPEPTTATPSPVEETTAWPLPSPASALDVAEPVDSSSGALDVAAVRRSLANGLATKTLGPHLVVHVEALADGGPRFSIGKSPAIPASTMKLLTATAALEQLGPDHVFTTRVVTGGGGSIVLVGGGDPYLASRAPADGAAAPYPARASVVQLARATARTLRQQGRRAVRLAYDASLFTGPGAAPTWEPTYLPEGVVAPISALWVDEGRPASGSGRVSDPAAYAAAAFARALAARGIKVQGAPRPRVAPDNATTLASVDSAPLSQIVERVLDVSDNEAAEVLAHHVGLSVVDSGSFRGGARGVTRTLADLGVPLAGARVHDGSGLSRQDRLDPDTLIGVLRVASDAAYPDLRPVVTGLPVAGFTGSLSYRFEDGAPAGRGSVRAKTGTLTGVSGLAGLVTDRSGTPLVFVMVADRVRLPDTLAARSALDAMAAALAACSCSS